MAGAQRRGRETFQERSRVAVIIALATQGLAFAPEDTATEQLDKLEAGLRALAAAETVDLLADFLGLPPPTRLQMSPELPGSPKASPRATCRTPRHCWRR